MDSADIIKNANSTELIHKTSEIGPAIIAAAEQAYREEWRKTVVDGVKRYLSLRDEARDRVEFFTRAIGWYTQKVEALGAGKFELTKRGEIIFENADLNRGNF